MYTRTIIPAYDSANLTFQLIYKIPEYSQPEYQSRGGIKGSSKIVLFEPKSILATGCIQVFKPDKTRKASDPEIVINMNIWTIVDSLG